MHIASWITISPSFFSLCSLAIHISFNQVNYSFVKIKNVQVLTVRIIVSKLNLLPGFQVCIIYVVATTSAALDEKISSINCLLCLTVPPRLAASKNLTCEKVVLSEKGYGCLFGSDSSAFYMPRILFESQKRLRHDSFCIVFEP